MNQGRCLCGSVQYEVEGAFFAVANCHCSMCRKHHGAPYVTWVVVPSANYRLTAGADSIGRYESSPGTHRAFCRRCGSVTPETTPSGEHVVVPAGNLEGDLPRPQLHMFVKDKAPWYVIADQLPQHEQWPPEYGMQPVTREPVRAVSEPGVHGSCLCGAVAYAVDAAPLRFMYCHCSRCRLARSAAHAANLFYPLEAFQWLRGAELVTEYALPGAQRFGVAFCSRCGSGVARPSPARNVVLVPAGSLDDEPGMAPEAHIFVDSRASWDVLGPDGIPRFAELPPGP
ncbi:MAG TPA: GFA family protein [Steroidobacteraceae bacterium]|nr:GFA family protein [Steroidobacteraceae bacterium]